MHSTVEQENSVEDFSKKIHHQVIWLYYKILDNYFALENWFFKFGMHRCVKFSKVWELIFKIKKRIYSVLNVWIKDLI